MEEKYQKRIQKAPTELDKKISPLELSQEEVTLLGTVLNEENNKLKGMVIILRHGFAKPHNPALTLTTPLD